MIGKLIGAFVGDRVARQTKGVGGATGAAIGLLAPTILRRISIPAMLAIGAGGYLAKKYFDRQEESGGATGDTAKTAPAKVKPSAT